MNNNEEKPDFTGQYPIAFGAIASSGKAKTINRFNGQIDNIKEALEQSEVVSTVLADIKYAANYVVAEAYEHYVDSPFSYAGKYKNNPESLQMLSCPNDLHSVKSFSKKLTKIPKEDQISPMYIAAKELTDELLNLWETMAFLKTHTISSKDKKKREMDAVQNEEDIWMKKLVSHKDSQRVVQLLKSKADYIEKELYESHLKDVVQAVNRFKKSSEEGLSDIHKIYPSYSHHTYFLQKLTERVYGPKEHYSDKKQYKLVDNYIEVSQTIAKKIASEIVNNFVSKNTSKLSYILYHKNNLQDVQINNINLSSGTVECDVECKFQDGSEFLANTSVVRSHSKYGLPFYRYPTIFSNIIMPDGSTLSQPSEQRMDELFALGKNDNIEDDQQTVTKRPKMK